MRSEKVGNKYQRNKIPAPYDACEYVQIIEKLLKKKNLQNLVKIKIIDYIPETEKNEDSSSYKNTSSSQTQESADHNIPIWDNNGVDLFAHCINGKI